MCLHGKCRKVSDILFRRTRLAQLDKRAAVRAVSVVADLLAAELQWSPAEKHLHTVEAYGDLAAVKAGTTAGPASPLVLREDYDRIVHSFPSDSSGRWRGVRRGGAGHTWSPDHCWLLSVIDLSYVLTLQAVSSTHICMRLLRVF